MSLDNTKDLLERYGFQQIFKKHLIEDNNFIEGSNSDYDLPFAIDRRQLFSYLKESQPKEFEKLERIPGYEQKFIKYLREEIHDRGLLDVLRGKVKFNGARFNMVTFKPQRDFNESDVKAYKSNKISVTEELVYKLKDDGTDGGRGDLTIFVNGMPIIWIELKCNTSGQSIGNAKEQYKTTRSPNDLVFKFKEGCLVFFAMDLDDVEFTTKLRHLDTFFMPYNKGNNMHKGNPAPDDPGEIKTAYMWKEILTKDNILEWIEHYFILEVKKEKDSFGHQTKKETMIFPRYHQFNEVNKLLADVKDKGVSGQNYLIMDSPGSGKTYSICWLAHHLSSLHDDSNKVIYDSVIVITDRLVVDGQLQKAILSAPHEEGTVEVMDDHCNSEDLASAINNGTRIIVSTIQKFSFILSKVGPMKHKKFALIIDECHSSTKGHYLENTNRALSMEEVDEDGEPVNDGEDYINDVLEEDRERSGKQDNITLFGFSATPKKKTREKFGTTTYTEDGQVKKVPFTCYSMQQAIEEGFILDVLRNYTTYETYFKTNKKIADDPELKQNKTEKAIYRSAMLHPTNIKQKIEIIMEHFISKVRMKLDGNAKAMVVTDGRESAVRYKMAFDAYILEHNIENIRALVAFTGEIKLKETGETKYTESNMNGFSEDETADAFDTAEYQVLLVANKFQTGYDQPLLCAMYVDKKLNGVNAVQTLGRLNRSYPGKEDVFVLDFKNSYDDMKKAFAEYYGELSLVGETDPNKIYGLERVIDKYHLVDDESIEKFIKLTVAENRTEAQKSQWYALLSAAKAKYDKIADVKEKDVLRKTIKQFVEQYSWIIQVTDFTDLELHKKHVFFKYLVKYLSADEVPTKVDVGALVSFMGFKQKKTLEVKVEKTDITPVKEETIGTTNISGKVEDEMVTLTQIIKNINELFAIDLDVNVSGATLLALKRSFLDDEEVILRAKNNKIDDFKLFLKNKMDKILIANRKSADKFYSTALENESIEVMILEYLITIIYDEARRKEESADPALENHDVITSRYYLAYGSNLNVAQMSSRCPGSLCIGKAKIDGYRLMFKKSQSGYYLTIEPAEGHYVPVGVFSVDEIDEKKLDGFEGYPRHYQKVNFRVMVTNDRDEITEVDAFAYVLPSDRELGKPTREYVERVLVGYREFGFDESLIDEALAFSRK